MPHPTDHGKSNRDYVRGLRANNGTAGNPDLPGTTEIGSGYDVLNGLFADGRSCFFQLFDLTKSGYVDEKIGEVTYSRPKALSYHWAPETSYTSSAGETIAEFSESFNSKTKIEGNYNFFSASITADFSYDKATNAQYVFSRVQQSVNVYLLTLPPLDQLRELLIPKFKKDIDELPPNEVFNNFGTHFVNRVIVGGRATYSSATNKLTYSSNYSLEVVAKMSYKTLVNSISGEEDAKYSQHVSNFNQSSDTVVTTRGGDPALGGDQLAAKMEEWSGSVLKFPTMVDFDDKSLIGVWELASTPERRKQLNEAYGPWAKDHAAGFPLGDGPYLAAMQVPLNTKINDDKGSGAKADVTQAKPDIGGDWYYLGPVAYQGYGNPQGYDTVVKELTPGVLADISSWKQIWNDSGSGKSNDYALWQGLASDPTAFKVVGDFFTAGDQGHQPPSSTLAARMKAISAQCLVKGRVGEKIWEDKGTGADADGSMWQVIAADSNGKSVNTFVATNNYSPPPDNREIFVLKANALAWVQNAGLRAWRSNFTFQHDG